jgi:hypothetical protein
MMSRRKSGRSYHRLASLSLTVDFMFLHVLNNASIDRALESHVAVAVL